MAVTPQNRHRSGAPRGAGRGKWPPRIRFEATRELLDRGYGKTTVVAPEEFGGSKIVKVVFGGRYAPDGRLISPEEDSVNGRRE